MSRLLAGALAPLLTVASLLCAAEPARSQDEKASPLPSHFPLRKEACFGRVYDAKHLAQHPKQRVTSFHVAREFTPDPYTEIEQTSTDELREQDGQDKRVNVSAYLRLRDKPGVFTNSFSCSRYEGKVTCGIDCDGGTFNLKESGPALLLENQGFVVIGGCGGTEEEQENSVNVLPGQDDKTFRLEPKPMAACTAERDTYVPAFAKLGKPLRERLAPASAVCFSRSYDAAHLASHPQQSVRRIAVLKPAGKPKEDRPDYDLVFRIETRNGKTSEYKANCVPEMYTFVCTFMRGSSIHGELYLARAGADQVMLRDSKGSLSKMLDMKLGRDDRAFRLQTAAASACTP